MPELENPAPGTGQEPTVTDPAPAPQPQPAPAAEPPSAPEPTAKPESAKPAEFKSMLGDEAKPEEGQDGGGENPQPEDFDIVLPEGFTADKDAVDFLKARVKDGKLSKEDAQEMADQHLAAVQRYEAWRASEGQKQIEAWEGEIKAHPDYGGIHLDRTVQNGKLMLQKYGSPKLIQDFNQMGVLSHPEFVYFLQRVHGDVSEGVSIGGAGEAAPETSAASTLYPTMKRK